NCRRVDGEAGKCSIIVMIFFLIAVRGPAHFDPHHRGRGLAPMRSAGPSLSLRCYWRLRRVGAGHLFRVGAADEEAQAGSTAYGCHHAGDWRIRTLRSRAKRLAVSTMTVRTPLLAMRVRSSAKPGRVSSGSCVVGLRA